ncbi:MAG: MgtC/SapB family protein [Phenylobacterium sp.]|uniref:MgtC/SapB family protein n=1 Tax=Phenylobacterium sp. TaxID=1871053 RepID=UPI00391BE834
MALGLGLLIGGERERRKRQQTAPQAAGIRTFAIVALTGAVAMVVGGPPLLALAVAGAGALAGLSYWRTRAGGDPGLTTEAALVLTALLGGLAAELPDLAAGLGVVTAILLAARTPLHRFVQSALSEDEARSALLLAAATLVVLPLLPDRPMGPFGAINPNKVWLLVIFVLAIGALGQVAVRTLGVRLGLPAAGLASGFISSAATIGAMGERAARAPAVLAPAVAGAALSTVATVVQMALVVGAASLHTLQALALPLACAGVAALAYGAAFTAAAACQPPGEDLSTGQAFSPATALVFAGLLCVVLVAAAALSHWFGERGAALAAAVAGLVDAHAAAISIASLAAAGALSPGDAVVPILAAFTANTLTKALFARAAGPPAFRLRVFAGLALVLAAAWAGFALQAWGFSPRG